MGVARVSFYWEEIVDAIKDHDATALDDFRNYLADNINLTGMTERHGNTVEIQVDAEDIDPVDYDSDFTTVDIGILSAGDEIARGDRLIGKGAVYTLVDGRLALTNYGRAKAAEVKRRKAALRKAMR